MLEIFSAGCFEEQIVLAGVQRSAAAVPCVSLSGCGTTDLRRKKIDLIEPTFLLHSLEISGMGVLTSS